MESMFTEVPIEQESYEVLSVCEVCGKSMPQSEYEKHLRSHKEKRMETCEICLKTFTNLSNFKYHMAHHSNDRPWLCTECPKNYKTKIDLLQHQRVHDKARDPFRCDICGQLFRTRSTFNTHHRTHIPKGPQKCEICDKVFVNLRSHHQMVHQGVRQHICKICDKAFGKKSGLDRHIITVHQKLRMWSCDLCDKSFGEKAQLQRHQKIHMNPMNQEHDSGKIIEDQQVFYKNKIRMRCGICRRIVNSKSALKRHKLLIHEKKREILCDYCPKLFSERSNLKKHVQKHHAEEVLRIGKEDPDTEDDVLDRNMAMELGFTETYTCQICYAVLSTTWGFKAHEANCLIKEQTRLNRLEEDSELKFEDFGKVEEVYLVDPDQQFEIKQEPLFNNEADGENMNETFDSTVKEEYLEEAFEEDNEQEFEMTGAPANEVIANAADGELLEYEFLDDVEVLGPADNEAVQEEDFLVDDVVDAPIEAELPMLPSSSLDRLKCDICSKSFKETRYYQSHMTTVHSKKRVRCEIKGCDETFVYRAQKMRHLRKVHPEVYEESAEETESENEPISLLECELCNTLVNSQEQHYCQVAKDEKDEAFPSNKIFECAKCPKKFSSIVWLNRHERNVHNKEEHHLNSNADVEDKEFAQCSIEEDIVEEDDQKIQSNKNSAKKDCSESDRTCDICFKVFKKTKYMEMHKSSVHDTGPQHFCPICNRGFSFQRSMDRHIRAIHEDRKDFMCSDEGCGKAFRSRYEVNEHFNNIHALIKKRPPVEEVTCDVCEKVCSSRKVLYSHKKMVHEGVKWGMKFECKLCKENFESKYKKTKHWGQVHRNGSVKMRRCHVCNTDFQLFEDFKNHIMKVHESSYICFICGKDYHDESSLFIHSESHRKVEEELRQYICDVCSHRLSTKAQLLIHMRKHFNGDYYICDVCGKSYKFIAPFLHHKMGHENRFDFPCRYCEKKFRVSRDRMLHERIHTKERPYKCDQCKKAFAHKANYVSHLKTHEFKAYSCKLCGFQLSSAAKLRQHEDQKHPEERPFKCVNCRKSFKATHSLDLHKQRCSQGVELTDDKDFSCFERTYV